ncbi:MAG: serine--tRNA ligase [Chloroflexota bacterium]|nr:serine--tRNA ligase [Chloroflexota bacterium]
MIDINLIREKPDWVKDQIRKLNDPAAMTRIDAIFDLDKQRRALLSESETLQAARNKLNKQFGMLRGNKKLDDAAKAGLAAAAVVAINHGDFDHAADILASGTPHASVSNGGAIDALMGALKQMGERVEALNDQLAGVDAGLQENLLWIPNLPHESTPVADSEDANIAHTPEGEERHFDFEIVPHWDLGPSLDIIDFERGVKIHGSRSFVLKGLGARLQRALLNFYLDSAQAHGFTEVYVPYMVKEEMMVGAGQFPKFRENVYSDPDAELYMLPTAEVAITNLHRDEILDESQLPLYYAAHTPCFRREQMSAGRDVRGIKRVHQFEKVELYKFTTPDTSYAELESLTEAASDVLRALQLRFRRLEIVTGDLGFSAAKKYDLEVWAPGSQEWLEVSSCSNTEAFQARRANIRYRGGDSKKTQFVHTLNGSGLATTRVMIAIMENYQQADGSVVVPDVLRPYMGGAEVIR